MFRMNLREGRRENFPTIESAGRERNKKKKRKKKGGETNANAKETANGYVHLACRRSEVVETTVSRCFVRGIGILDRQSYRI